MFILRFADGRVAERSGRAWTSSHRLGDTVLVSSADACGARWMFAARAVQRSAMAASGGVRAARTPGQRAASTPTTAELIRTSTS
jgi:hypothetical protein